MQHKKHNQKKRPKKKGCVTARTLRRIISCRNARDRKATAEIDRLNNTPLGHPDHNGRLMLAFNPILNWLNQVEQTCDMDVTNKGVAILYAPDHPSSEKWFQLDSAFIAVADTYELIAIDKSMEDQSAGLRQVGNKVAAGMMLFQSDIEMARQSIDWMIKIAKGLSPLQITEYTSIIATRALIAQAV